MDFRSRLYSIKNEKQLWNYFCENAGYIEKYDSYTVAGIYSSDTRSLWLKLVDEWKEDIIQRAKEVLNA